MREIQCELPQKRARHMPNLFQRQQTGHFGTNAPYYGKEEQNRVANMSIRDGLMHEDT